MCVESCILALFDSNKSGLFRNVGIRLHLEKTSAWLPKCWVTPLLFPGSVVHTINHVLCYSFIINLPVKENVKIVTLYILVFFWFLPNSWLPKGLIEKEKKKRMNGVANDMVVECPCHVVSYKAITARLFMNFFGVDESWVTVSHISVSRLCSRCWLLIPASRWCRPWKGKY